MKQLFWAGVLALPLLVLPSEAKAFCIGGYEVDTGAKVWCNVTQFNLTTPKAGPWYLYWPYQAHFQVAAPGINPYFTPPMTLPPGFGQPPPLPPPPGYRPPMPQVGQGYYPPAPPVAQGYQPSPPQSYYQPGPAAQGYPGYQPSMPQGPPHPQVYSYFGR